MAALGSFDQAVMNLQSAQTPSAKKLNQVAIDKAHKAAVDFEGFFIAKALEEMFAGIPTDGMFGGGNGEKIFRSMLLQQYGKEIAEKSSIGLADAVQREIIRHQEAVSQGTQSQGTKSHDTK
jgi:flagellar protein FlgJ